MSTRVRLLVLAALPALSVPGLPAAGQTAVPRPSPWQLVYAVDSLGRRMSGEKSALIAAVRAGQPVRVGFGVSWRLPDGTPGGVEHVAEAAFVSIYKDEVFAQLPPILGQTPSH